MSGQRWPADRRAEAIGLGVSLGVIEAAKRTGIPRRTISKWLQEPDALIVREQTREDVAAALWQVVSEGTAEARRRIKDPATRAGELAQLIKVAADQYALLTGGVTDRTESLNVHAEAELIQPVTTATLRAQLAEFMAMIENATDDEIAEHEHRVLQMIHGAKSLTLYAGDKPAEFLPTRSAVAGANDALDDFEAES